MSRRAPRGLLGASLAFAALLSSGLGEGQGTTPTAWGSEGNAVTIKVNTPAGSAALPDDALPQMQLDGVPGGKTILRRGVGKAGSESRIIALCVQASSGMWAPDLEATVFDRLNDTVKQELERKGSVDRFEPSKPQAVPPRFEATLQADLAVYDRSKPRPLDPNLVPKVRVAARSTLGFVGGDANLVVCSVICSELSSDAPHCASTLAGTNFVASFVPAPSPSIVARILGSFARAPLASSGFAVGLFCALLGLLLAAWPPRKAAAATEPKAPTDDDED